VHHEQYQADHQGNMNESAGDVKCEKTKQPKNNQDGGNHSKHIVISLRLSARTAAIMCIQTGE
jgi:hypothetical protein